jgi:hypothetical protein
MILTIQKGKDEYFVELGYGETGIRKRKPAFYITTTCPTNNGALRHLDVKGT